MEAEKKNIYCYNNRSFEVAQVFNQCNIKDFYFVDHIIIIIIKVETWHICEDEKLKFCNLILCHDVPTHILHRLFYVQVECNRWCSIKRLQHYQFIRPTTYPLLPFIYKDLTKLPLQSFIFYFLQVVFVQKFVIFYLYDIQCYEFSSYEW